MKALKQKRYRLVGHQPQCQNMSLSRTKYSARCGLSGKSLTRRDQLDNDSCRYCGGRRLMLEYLCTSILIRFQWVCCPFIVPAIA